MQKCMKDTTFISTDSEQSTAPTFAATSVTRQSPTLVHGPIMKTILGESPSPRMDSSSTEPPSVNTTPWPIARTVRGAGSLIACRKNTSITHLCIRRKCVIVMSAAPESASRTVFTAPKHIAMPISATRFLAIPNLAVRPPQRETHNSLISHTSTDMFLAITATTAMVGTMFLS